MAETEPKRRRLDLAVAVAQENLMATHVDHALHMVDVVGQDIPFDEMLEIYARMLRLSAGEAQVITTRALATLGVRGDDPEPDSGAEAESPDGDANGNKDRPSFFGQLRHRLRGRINEDLRTTIELLTGRTEAALLRRHVENALEFVALFEKDDGASDAIDLYIDALDVRDAMNEVVYHLVLARLADDRLTAPAPLASGGAAEAHPLEAETAPERKQELRIVSGEGD